MLNTKTNSLAELQLLTKINTCCIEVFLSNTHIFKKIKLSSDLVSYEFCSFSLLHFCPIHLLLSLYIFLHSSSTMFLL